MQLQPTTCVFAVWHEHTAFRGRRCLDALTLRAAERSIHFRWRMMDVGMGESDAHPRQTRVFDAHLVCAQP